MDRIGIEFLTVGDLSPPDFVSLAADCGCAHISMLLSNDEAMPFGPGYFLLRNDAAFRRQVIARMRDTGVSISLGEGLVIRRTVDVDDYAKDLEIMAELSVTRINTVSMEEEDEARTVAQIARLAQMAGQYGIELTIEFCPMFVSPRDLAQAQSIIAKAAQPNLKILVDTLHLMRSGGAAADLKEVAPELYGYVQISDGPLGVQQSYMEEAVFDRAVPGEGQMPLADIVAALPADLIISCEVPLRRLADAGLSLEARVRRAVEGARKVVGAAA